MPVEDLIAQILAPVILYGWLAALAAWVLGLTW